MKFQSTFIERLATETVVYVKLHDYFGKLYSPEKNPKFLLNYFFLQSKFYPETRIKKMPFWC